MCTVCARGERKEEKKSRDLETFTGEMCQSSPLLTPSLPVFLCLSPPRLCSSSLLGSWSARSCRAVPVHSFRTRCVCDSLSTFAILARVNLDSVSLRSSLSLHLLLLLLPCLCPSIASDNRKGAFVRWLRGCARGGGGGDLFSSGLHEAALSPCRCRRFCSGFYCLCLFIYCGIFFKGRNSGATCGVSAFRFFLLLIAGDLHTGDVDF